MATVEITPVEKTFEYAKSLAGRFTEFLPHNFDSITWRVVKAEEDSRGLLRFSRTGITEVSVSDLLIFEKDVIQRIQRNGQEEITTTMQVLSDGTLFYGIDNMWHQMDGSKSHYVSSVTYTSGSCLLFPSLPKDIVVDESFNDKAEALGFETVAVAMKNTVIARMRT